MLDGSHGQTPHTTFLTWDMHLGHGRRTTNYTFFTVEKDGWNGIKIAFRREMAREGMAQSSPTQRLALLLLVSYFLNSPFLPIMFLSSSLLGVGHCIFGLFSPSSQLGVFSFPVPVHLCDVPSVAS